MGAAIRRASWSVAALVAFALTACGGDDPSEYTITLTIDKTTLTADGSDAATVRAVVLDQRGNPPAVGSAVALTAANGNVNATGQPQAAATTDTSGVASFTVRCTSTEPVTLVGVFERTTRGVLRTPVTCDPAPTGDWRLIVAATPRSVRPQGSSAVTVSAVDGASQPVPQGTGIVVFVAEPNPGASFRTGGTRALIETPDASGAFSIPVTAPDAAGPFSVCAQFADQRFGPGARCVTISVGSGAESSGCVGVFAPNAIPADGESTSVLTLSLFDSLGQPVRDGEIEVIVEGLGELLEDPTDPTSGTDTLVVFTDDAGQAEIEVLAAATTGTANVVGLAFYDDQGTAVEAECDMQTLVYYPAPICTFDPILPLNVGRTQSVRVCFSNPAGQNVAPGTPVTLSLPSTVAGTSLSATTVVIPLNDANRDGVADDPCVTTGISAGSISGSVTVRAEIPFGTTTSSCQSEPVPILSEEIVARQLVLSCDGNVGAFLFDRGSITSTCSVGCTALVRDLNNNPLVGAPVTFSTETGAILGTAITGPGGIVNVPFYIGGSYPLNVAPRGGGEFQQASDDATGAVRNQRDGLVSIIAMTSGMEDFTDANGNGVYDPGELFYDLPEPFVDADDDNLFGGNARERFYDVELPGRRLNGVWDGPNGEWDANTVIWADARMVYSGWVDPRDADFSPALAGGRLTVGPGNTSISWTPTDERGNSLPEAATIDVETTCARLGLEEGVVSGGFGLGRISANRRERFFSGGAPVSPESGVYDSAQWVWELVFGASLDDRRITLPIALRPGDEESCLTVFTVTQRASETCPDEFSSVFEVPTRVLRSGP